MLQFVCDYCARVKQPEERWINGVAAENVGTQAARREVLVDPTWRYDRAVLPLAVHFCSLDCKDRYLEKLFQTPMSLLEVESATTVPAAGKRVVVAKRRPVASTARKVSTRRRKR